MKNVCLDGEDISILYEEIENTIEICGLKTLKEKIKLHIPEFINEKKVVAIRGTALCGNNVIEKIVIPGTIKKINQRSVQGCKSLKEIVIKEGVEEIEEYTFWGNDNLEKIFLPKSLKVIHKRAFPSSDKLSYLKLNEGIEKIEKSNFKYLSLDYLYLPSTLKEVGEKVLYGSKVNVTVFKGTKEEFNKLKEKFSNVDFGRVLFLI